MATTVVSTRIRLGGVVAFGLVVLLSLAVVFRDRDSGSAGLSPDLSIDDDRLLVVSSTPVIFGHQSVGMNILGGVPAIYASAGLDAPEIIESQSAPDVDVALAHAYIGQNGDPAGKVADFAEKMRSGYGQWAGVALMKLCFVDIVAGTDVNAVFGEYKATMAQLEDEFPEATFLHLTVPLTTEPGLKSKLKVALGRGQDDRADNVVREKYNSMVRAEYGATGRLVDVAALESTRPDGSRVSGEVDGAPYFALFDGFASDPGHLNEVGSQVVAAGLLDVMGANLND